MRKAKERLGQPRMKPGLLQQIGVRNYKFDGNVYFQGSEDVTNADGRTEFNAMQSFGFGTTDYHGEIGTKPHRTIDFNAKDSERAKQIKQKLDAAGFKQE